MVARIPLALLGLLIIPCVGSAATLSNVSGNVLINRGQGFVPVSDPADLSPGDRILVRPNARADIVYRKHCIVSLRGGQTAVVSLDDPCDASGILVPNNRLPLQIAGVIGLGGLAIAIAEYSQSDSDSRPVSP